VWDVVTGNVVRQLKGHDGSVTALAFAADGQTLVSGSSDTTLLTWDATRLNPTAKLPPVELQAREIEALWADLGGFDAARAFQAIQTLVRAPRQAVPFLSEQLRPAAPLDPMKINQWITDLDSPKFQLRRDAAVELEKLGEMAVPALNKVLAGKPSLEVQKRVEELLAKASGRTLSSDQLRILRGLEVLEQLDTAEARQVLESLARGAPGALPTREGQAALDRLGKVSSPRP
jgi:hypothetical protein